MITILQVISDTNIGGGGRCLLNYLRCQDRSAFRSEVVLPRGSALLEDIRALDVGVHEIDAMADKSMDLRAIPLLRKVIRQVRPDIVHTHGSLSGRVAARLCGKRTLYTRHCVFPMGGIMGGPAGRVAGRVMDACLSDGVIAVSPSVREQLLESGVPDRKIHMLFNGVAPLNKPSPQDRAALRREYGFEPEDFVAGMLARIEPYKGQGLLLAAARDLIGQGRRIKLLFAGTGGDEQRLREQAAGLPPGSVVFTGFLREVERALWAMDVQVNASTESEATSLSLLEGMSLGLPAVVSDVGGNPAIIQDGENGLVFPRRDVNALAGALARLMDSPGTLRAMSVRAEEIFNARYTGAAFAKNLERVYQDALKGAKYGR